MSPLHETLLECERLLFVARDASAKLRTMYMRGETERRYELDALVEAHDAIREAIRKIHVQLGA